MRKQCVPGLSLGGRGLGTRLTKGVSHTDSHEFAHDHATFLDLHYDTIPNVQKAVSAMVWTKSCTEGGSGHAADFVAILAVVLTKHDHGEHEGGARVWTYRNLDQLPFFC